MNTPGILPQSGRVLSIDVTRGLVMALMTLDHVRSSFTAEAAKLQAALSFLPPANPEDLAISTPFFFCMRWITHLCAPTFIFLAGVGAFLWMCRHGAERSLTRYLFTRGLFIVVLNLFMNPRTPFSLQGNIGLFVLWAIGMSMILLAFAVKLPRPLLWALSLGLLFGHNLLDGVAMPPFPWDVFPRLLLVGGVIPWGGGPDALRMIVAYPVLPWFGVMLLGYLCGGLFRLPDSGRRQRLLFGAGCLCLLTFLFLRLVGGYGDVISWQQYDVAWKTAASLVRITKYPPSLQFCLVTLGGMAIILACMERFSLRPKLLLALGSVPLLYYVAHFFVIQCELRLFRSLVDVFSVQAFQWCFSAGGILLLSALVLVVLYPFCTGIIGLRKRRRAAGARP